MVVLRSRTSAALLSARSASSLPGGDLHSLAASDTPNGEPYQSSPRYLDPERGQLGRRRGHVPQISISDDNHHVTEAIGDMYGGNDWNKRDSTASNLASSPTQNAGYDHKSSYFEANSPVFPAETSAQKSTPNERYPASMGSRSPVEGRRRQPSWGSNQSGHSPPLLTRSDSDTSSQHFPINDIDYESSPAAVAQELSNLQAIRRISMNVDAADPDLPSFGPSISIPTAAPSASDDEDDAARMFWVPARIHPELAPKEFKTFVENRVERMRKRSGENEHSSDYLQRSGSNDSLNRRKSMLSRTIDNAIGYHDGAELLERKRSQGSGHTLDAEHTLQELSSMVDDPSEAVRKISIESARLSLEGGLERSPDDDSPILPTAPGGQSLKRSTRTNYRRGSLRKGERVTGSRRVAQRLLDGDTDHRPQMSPQTLTTPQSPDDLEFRLARSHTEPMPPPDTTDQPDNFSRPSRKGRPAAGLNISTSLEDMRQFDTSEETNNGPHSAPSSRSFVSRIASNGRTTASLLSPSGAPAESQSGQPPWLILPEIVETPPPPQPGQGSEYRYSAPVQMSSYSQQHPERKSSKSSQEYSRYSQSQLQGRSFEQRPPLRPAFSNSRKPDQTLNDMASNPSMMPGTNTRTDTLSFIPTFTEEKKSEKKSKDRKEKESGDRKPSWGWLLGSQDSEEKKDKKEREREEKELSRKSVKAKFSKSPTEKSRDPTRLDVLQTATDGSRGRESLVLDRESFRLEEERKKDASSRKSTDAPSKKDAAAGIFSSLFGGSKKKHSERDSTSKKSDNSRRLSPEPPPQILRADIDYNWTRFSILEERAIYRMAHLKLANPRRALYSQVLLSNFMYSYLAKVQQMHPQVQIPAFVQKQQKERGSVEDGQENDDQEQSQNAELAAWQNYQDQQDGGSSSTDEVGGPSDPHSSSSNTDFVEDYDPMHQQSEDSHSRSQYHDSYQQQYAYEQQHQRPYTNGNPNPYGQQQQYSSREDQQWDTGDVYTEQGLFDDARPPDEREGDLW